MAEPQRPPEKLSRAELIAALEGSRIELQDDLLDLRESLSVSRRVQSSYQKNLGKWLAGGAVVGFFLARPLFRIERKKAGSKNRFQSAKGSTALGGPLAGIMGFASKNAGKLILPIVKIVVTSYIGKILGALPDAENANIEADTLD